MTTIESISLLKPVTYAEISSCEAEDWQHPMLEMFRPIVEEHEKQKARLYLIPSSFDDEYDPDFSPQPTSASNSRARSRVSNSTASPRLKVAFVSPSVT